MYKCAYCDREFKDKGNLRKHEKHYHENIKETITCPFCHKLFEKCGISSHVKSCKENPDRYVSKKETNKKKAFEWFSQPGNCRFCGKLCKNGNSLLNHERLCIQNPNRKPSGINHIDNLKGYREKIKSGELTIWNKGLTKDTDDRISKASEKIRLHYQTHSGTFLGRHHSSETRKKMSDRAKELNYNERFGYRKSFKYKDVVFQSSYEMKVAMSLDENNIKWEKATNLPYIDNNNVKHYYTPDIYLKDYNIYLDPKNDFLINNVNPHFGYSDYEKINWVMEQNGVKILILNKDQLDWKIIKTLL